MGGGVHRAVVWGIPGVGHIHPVAGRESYLPVAQGRSFLEIKAKEKEKESVKAKAWHLCNVKEHSSATWLGGCTARIPLVVPGCQEPVSTSVKKIHV